METRFGGIERIENQDADETGGGGGEKFGTVGLDRGMYVAKNITNRAQRARGCRWHDGHGGVRVMGEVLREENAGREGGRGPPQERI